MLKKLLFCLILCALTTPVGLFAQSNAMEEVLRATNQAQLMELSKAWQQRYWQQRMLALEQAAKLGWPLRWENSRGDFIELDRLTDWGEPLYRTTDNRIAARTISANRVYPGGSAGLSLTGQGLNIGIWDGGAVRGTHQELTGRVTQVDGATSLSAHATHVAGTLMASGVDTNARGMAYQANLRAHDWNNDNSEMATAAAGGLLISNHSYGWISGWNSGSTTNGTSNFWYGWEPYSRTEDYKFGYYDEQARDWDQICNNAPFYLIVKSAGNDRGESRTAGTSHNVQDSVSPFGWRLSTTTRNADGNATGYDCIVGGGVGKNVLTVGAVNGITNGYSTPEGVVMSSFSGWGPTDDGRIKPDLVAKGVGTYSSTSTSNTAYSTLNGTSMASPSVSGGLLLLQQHFNNTKSRFMRSSTLKALAIHTADEAGSNPGPDYRFGWGLLNVQKAAAVISQDGTSQHILEDSLNQAQTWELELYSDGSSPLRATLAWNDPFATLVAHPNLLNNTAVRLVNDLDLRIVRNSDNSSFQPWILNPASPANAATTGDNNRDNVEQVLLSSPTAGWYTVRITHKGNLRNSRQLLSLIISGATRLNTFTGTANWTSVNNWTAASSPSASTDALVKSGTLTINSTAQVKNLWVKGGATVQLSAPLTVNGSLINAGTFSSSSQLTMNSSTAHVLQGATSVNQLTKAGNGALTLEVDTTRVNNLLTISAGSLITNGRLVLQNGAQLLDNVSTVNPGGAISGQIHQELTGSTHGRVYNFWSSPVSNAQMSGVFAGTEPSDMRSFNAGTQSWDAANGSTMLVGRGYTATGSSNGLRRFSGQPNNGSISTSVVANPGNNNDWNLVGNPYPSAISASAFVSANASRINGSLYFWDRTAPYVSGSFIADYAVWNNASQVSGSGGRTPNGWIQPGQGFFVEATSSGALSFNNSMRNANSGVFFRPAAQANRLWITLKQQASKSQTAVVFRDDATLGFDPMLDARKLKTQNSFNLGTLGEQEVYAIQSLPVVKDYQQVPLQIDLPAAGKFYLELDSTEGEHPSGPLRLWDSQTGYYYPMNLKVPVELQAPNAMSASGRYFLTWGKNDLVNEPPVLQTWVAGNDAVIRVFNPSELKITLMEVYDVSGRKVWSEKLETTQNSLERDINMPGGIYLVRLIGNFRTSTTRLVITR